MRECKRQKKKNEKKSARKINLTFMKVLQSEKEKGIILELFSLDYLTTL